VVETSYSDMNVTVDDLLELAAKGWHPYDYIFDDDGVIWYKVAKKEPVG